MKDTPWTTREALQHLKLRLEAYLLNRTLFHGMRLLEKARKRLARVALRERAMTPGYITVQPMPRAQPPQTAAEPSSPSQARAASKLSS